MLAIKNGDETRLAPPSDTMIWVGTVLGALGKRDQVNEFANLNLLRVQARLSNFRDMFNPNRAGIAEAVIPPNSRFVKKAVGELHLRKRHGISVLAIYRGEEVFREDVRKTPLRAGDTLVLHGFWRDLAVTAGRTRHRRHHRLSERGTPSRQDLARDAVLRHRDGARAVHRHAIVDRDAHRRRRHAARRRAEHGRGVSRDQLENDLHPRLPDTAGLGDGFHRHRRVDRAGSAALSRQLAATGALQAVIAILALFFSQVVSNVGAAVMMVPMAINIALASGNSPAVYALIVAISTSNSFIIASANPVLTIVAGPGGYRARDFLRVGMPLTILLLVVLLVVGQPGVSLKPATEARLAASFIASHRQGGLPMKALVAGIACSILMVAQAQACSVSGTAFTPHGKKMSWAVVRLIDLDAPHSAVYTTADENAVVRVQRRVVGSAHAAGHHQPAHRRHRFARADAVDHRAVRAVLLREFADDAGRTFRVRPVTRLLHRVREPHLAVDGFDGDRRQPAAHARTGETAPGFDAERRAVRGADQESAVDQETAGRPVQPPPGVRAFVVIGEHAFTLAQQHEIESARRRRHIDSEGISIRYGVEPA